MKLYYRISDKSYDKVKLPGATKKTCFWNTINAFGLPSSDVRVIADNCEDSTLEQMEFFGEKAIRTNLGNAGSFRYALDLALEENAPDEIVYFAEDDYLYLPDAAKYVQDGMANADFVTLYDHPDKYTKRYQGGEISKVIKTHLTHWRYTVSTCMTFATRVELLQHDYNVWKEYTSGEHPNDHQAFCDLNGRGRRLAVCIPGRACHTDLTFSGQVSHVLIDPWAIDMMIHELDRRLDEAQKDNFPFWLLRQSILENKKLGGWELLKMQAALLDSAENAKTILKSPHT